MIFTGNRLVWLWFRVIDVKRFWYIVYHAVVRLIWDRAHHGQKHGQKESICVLGQVESKTHVAF